MKYEYSYIVNMICYKVFLYSFDKIYMIKLENSGLDFNDFIVNFM